MKNMLKGLKIEDQEFLEEFDSLVTAVKLMEIKYNDSGVYPFRGVMMRMDDGDYIKFEVMIDKNKVVCVTAHTSNYSLQTANSILDRDHVRVVRTVKSWL